ncbi:Helix-turn-helix of insertion element transposase [Halobacillus alkaliphilus]|uniref:Helix-turn-helix of insertion element transposase n=1 Tax=Halobacillus alkaliphilus TaxID=396056 RepID=A0A1I2NB54_9BACI|nr:phBC6A51 family helix-turn-helix protein [Halobacillus alkaliphilus]SFF98967.1 Helix-turn-helix of insertion element transposase [Halobacillus alkaliphilus]
MARRKQEQQFDNEIMDRNDSAKTWAIEFMSLSDNGGYTQKELAEKLGVSRKTITRWKKDEHFQEEVRKRAVEKAGEHLPEVLDVLMQNIRAGKDKSIENYLKLVGLIQENQFTFNQNVNTEEQQTNDEINKHVEDLREQLQQTESIDVHYREVDTLEKENEK